MDVARLNLSHGAHAEHERIYQRIRTAAAETGKNVGIMVDLQGPKIRLAEFAEGKVTLTYGERFTITTREVPGDVTICGTTYDGLPGDVRPGDQLLIDDGRIALVAEEVTETDVICRVVVGGPVSNHKGINLPGVTVSVPAMSEKDVEDLRWALHLPADMIALSFVRDGSDIQLVHKIMDEEGHRVPVIAKIEKPQAVANLDEIIEAFDGFMVARGDLGVELPLEEVPLVQKLIIDQARLKEATDLANLRRLVDGLPMGYQTNLSWDGLSLSGGEMQRVLIARTIYKNPSYLFFDEATSSLDANNEKEIMEKLHPFYEGRTVLIIAHRLSTVRHADKIVVLNNGEIVEEGNHEELVARRGKYFELVKNQLELGN